MSNYHLWFAGTPEFAANSLARLLEETDYQIDGVLTQPDRPAGRGRKLTASAVKALALTHHLPVAQPAKLVKEAPPFPELPRPDICIVAAYGLLLPQWFLEYPKYGCINIHASLLPRWRGAAPIQRAIAAGDEETGVGIMQMDKGLDTGALWLEKRLPITQTDTAATLTDKLAKLGGDALLEALPIIFAGASSPTPQASAGATYAHKLSKDEAHIDWQQSAASIAQNIRAFNPFPVAFARLDGENVRLFSATASAATSYQTPGAIIQHDKTGLYIATAAGTLIVHELQLPGKKRTTAEALANGRNLQGHHLQ